MLSENCHYPGVDGRELLAPRSGRHSYCQYDECTAQSCTARCPGPDSRVVHTVTPSRAHIFRGDTFWKSIFF